MTPNRNEYPSSKPLYSAGFQAKARKKSRRKKPPTNITASVILSQFGKRSLLPKAERLGARTKKTIQTHQLSSI
jgi:hypothetical protein